MSKTDVEETAVLEAVVGKTAYPARTPFVALFSGAPTESGGGVELSGGGYTRKATVAADWANATRTPSAVGATAGSGVTGGPSQNPAATYDPLRAVYRSPRKSMERSGGISRTALRHPNGHVSGRRQRRLHRFQRSLGATVPDL